MSDNTNNEEWYDVPGYEGLYKVSDLGRVKSLWGGKEKFRKPIISTNGELEVVLYKPHKIADIMKQVLPSKKASKQPPKKQPQKQQPTIDDEIDKLLFGDDMGMP